MKCSDFRIGEYRMVTENGRTIRAFVGMRKRIAYVDVGNREVGRRTKEDRWWLSVKTAERVGDLDEIE